MLFASTSTPAGGAEVDAGRDDTPDEWSWVNVCVGEAPEDRGQYEPHYER